MAEGRRTFGPVVLLGLATAGLSAVAGTRELVVADVTSGSSSSGSTAMASTLVIEAGGGQAPLAGALALVLLACWGVLLVTRGRVRRAVTWLALVVALGLVATVVTAGFTLESQFRDALADLTVTDVDLTWSPWFWVAVVLSALAVVPALAGVRLVGTWPEMGSKYDAPADRAATPLADDPDADESQALWKAIDEGHDPTR